MGQKRFACFASSRTQYMQFAHPLSGEVHEKDKLVFSVGGSPHTFIAVKLEEACIDGESGVSTLVWLRHPDGTSRFALVQAMKSDPKHWKLCHCIRSEVVGD